MSRPRYGKTYNIMNVGNDKMLNLFSLGKASNGMNVVLYDADGSDEQKWTYDDRRLFIETNPSYCLDRFNDTRYSQHDNADIWKESSKEDDNQEIEIIRYGSHYKIRLLSENLYLTGNKGSNGTGSGKTTSSRGNVYWAHPKSTSYQEWDFDEVKSSGGDDTGSGKGNGRISNGERPSTLDYNSYGYSPKYNIFHGDNTGYYAQCTWHCYGRAYEVLGKKIKFDHTGSLHGGAWWARVEGCKRRQTPKANSIAVWVELSPNGTEPDAETAPGHVAYVEKVDGNNIYISEANYGGNYNTLDSTDGIIHTISSKTKMEKHCNYTDNRGRHNFHFKGYIYL